MSISKNEWKYEENRLEMIKRFITNRLQYILGENDKFKNELIDTQKEMRENVTIAPSSLYDIDGIAQAWQYQTEIKREARAYKFTFVQSERLKKMLYFPYFGRIDFMEDGEKLTEQIYIGIGNLIDEDKKECLIYDWRAPVSSMFYDYETGRASYECPDGLIEGDLTLKRQYKISNGKIDYMFDSNLKIDDEILQEILAKSVDNKMKTIVMTIQREQNKAIRDDNHQLLIVQGPAGSGKTSIALHRIAYLLYKHRKNVGAKNIVIFSPNQIFNDYISDVLPQLGEENMYQTTFMEYAEKVLQDAVKIEDMNGQMEYLLCCPNENKYKYRIQSIKLKASKHFLDILKNYAGYLENMDYNFKDIAYKGKVIISGEEINTLFHRDYAYFPVEVRMKKIKRRIFFLLKPYERERIKEIRERMKNSAQYYSEDEIKFGSVRNVIKEFRPLKDNAREMTAISFYDAYIKLFENRQFFAGCPMQDYEEMKHITISSISQGKINYEDVAPLIYLKNTLDGKFKRSLIKYMVIDEAQDYTPVQIEVLKQSFGSANITILGDMDQSINPYMNIEKYEYIPEIFKDKSKIMINLSKSYRSTEEITTFSRRILTGRIDADFINRHGDKPVVYKLCDDDNLYDLLASDIKRLLSGGYKSIALICRTAARTDDLYKHIKDKINIGIIRNDDEEYRKGVVAIPSYLSKGLEFDAVIVPDAESYCGENERRLFYTVCTRALHELHMYFRKDISLFVRNIDRQYYSLVDQETRK
ncbi:MAG: RNA polymerase recycling motor HelD [Clostridiales bacterium]|nr:RNA polymerase recycling motor HelD [Clostridiales bacterium]